MKLTVLIPIYNTRPEALLESIHSILQQDDKTPHDIILIDDGSTSAETKAAIDCLVNVRVENPILLYTMESNSGTSAALNKGHLLAKTEYIAIQGSDDISDRSRFRKQIEYLKRHPDTDVLGTNLFMFQDKDMYRRPTFTSSHPEKPKPTTQHGHWIVNHGTVIYRNQAVKDTGGYNPEFARAQDIELWGRMWAKGYKFKNITEVLYAWRRYK